MPLIKYTLRTDRGNTCEWQGSYPRRLHQSYWLGWQGTIDTMGENSWGLKAHMTQDVGDQAWQQKQEICSSSGKKRLHIFEITGWMQWKNCPDLDRELGGGGGVAIFPLRFALHVTLGQQYSLSQTLYAMGKKLHNFALISSEYDFYLKLFFPSTIFLRYEWEAVYPKGKLQIIYDPLKLSLIFALTSSGGVSKFSYND